MDLLINAISKSYGGKKAVDGVEYKFKPGIYALLGPNGAGKSTLMKMICNIEKPDKGNIWFDGKNIHMLKSEYFAKLGYLPQDWGYYPQFTVKDFMNYFSVLKGIPANYSKKEIRELLEMFGLENLYKKKIRTLSRGMIQRMGIAQALLGRPDILVLDEPTAGLDPKERLNFRNILNDYSKDKIIILSTHIVSDVEVLANEILVMDTGKLIRHGTRNELINELQGKVWEYSVGSRQAVNKDFPVISTRYDNDFLVVRVLSQNKPFENARRVDANLEDMYFYYFSNDKGTN
jgi:ABC-2 type transport system ATP-binding protein